MYTEPHRECYCNITEVSQVKLGEAPCTHVPRTSLKSKIFLMSSTCFFHVSPLPVSPFSRAMALLYRPKSDRHWAAGGGRMRSGGEKKINEIKKGSIFCKNKKEKWGWAGSERFGVRSAAAGPRESSCRLPCPCRLPPPLLLSLPPPPPPLRPSGQQLSTPRGNKSASRRGFQNKSMLLLIMKQWGGR